ncbi:MAG: hypothetical protein D6731_25890, partial [Planctomycetota bacterium]
PPLPPRLELQRARGRPLRPRRRRPRGRFVLRRRTCCKRSRRWSGARRPGLLHLLRRAAPPPGRQGSLQQPPEERTNGRAHERREGVARNLVRCAAGETRQGTSDDEDPEGTEVPPPPRTVRLW